MPKKVKEPAKKKASPKKKSTAAKKTTTVKKVTAAAPPKKKTAKTAPQAKAARPAPKAKTSKTAAKTKITKAAPVKKAAKTVTKTKTAKTSKTVSVKKLSRPSLTPVSSAMRIPAEIVALFDAFDLDNEKFSIKKIEAAVKTTSLKELNNLIKSIDLTSEEGLSLQKKLVKSSGFRDADISVFKNGQFKDSTLLLKCLCDKNLYREWLGCFRKICCCCCCSCCDSWPIVHPVHPFCKYCCRCRLVRVQKDDAGTFYAHTLDFRGAGVTVSESPLHEANITIDGGGGGVALPLPWNQVDKAGSSVAHLATRNHSDLNGTGANTHAQVDTHIANANGVHGAAGNVVGTSDAQTLTNKTLTSPQIDGTLSGTALQNDATFAAAAANRVASSSSIKSYVDNSIGDIIDDAADNTTSAWSAALINNRMRVVSGEYYGNDWGAGWIDGGPFKFNINSLLPNPADIDNTKVFIYCWGYKTNGSGVIESPLQITWEVVNDGTDHIAALNIADINGNLYQDPSAAGVWELKKVYIKIYATYSPNGGSSVAIPVAPMVS